MQIRRTKRILLKLVFVSSILFAMVWGIKVIINNDDNSMAVACNPNATTIVNAVCLQDMNDSVRESMELETQYMLVDSRDERGYFISKLSDGNIWMTQNLDLGKTDTTISLDATNTDISVDSTFTTLPVAQVRVDSDFYTTNGGYIEGGDVYLTTSGSWARDIIRDFGSSHYRLGNGYPWTVATAQTMEYVDPSDQTGINFSPSDSICPAGWKLPSQIEYKNLLIAYDLFEEGADYEGSEATSSDLRNSPMHFIRGFPYTLGTEGHYWTSTTSLDVDHYVARVFFLDGYNSGSSYRTDELSGTVAAVRCIARPDSSFTYTLSYSMNGGPGSIESVVINSGHKRVDTTVSDVEPTWTHHNFLGWSESSSASVASYHGGDEIALGGNKTLHAVWEVVVSDQEVSFAQSSITKTYGDSSFINTATTTGDGTITYSSSNTDVAEVDASTGEVTIKSVGTAVITANAAATTYYSSAFASYTLTVNKKTSSQPVEVSETKTGYVTDMLSSVILETVGLAWNDDMERIEEGSNAYAVTYTENDDTHNYTTESFEVTVRGVRRAYEIIEGDGQVYMLGGDKEIIRFIVNANYSLFEEGGTILINGELLDAQYYTAEAGEDDTMIINLLHEYLESLAAGNYTLAIYFDDGGLAEGSFAVEEEDVPPVPNTGRSNHDRNNAGITDTLICVLPGGMMGVILTVLYMRRAKRTHRKFDW